MTAGPARRMVNAAAQEQTDPDGSANRHHRELPLAQSTVEPFPFPEVGLRVNRGADRWP